MSEPSGEDRTADETIGTDETAAGGEETSGAATVDPVPPQEFVEAARLAPNHWLYLIDPAWSGDAPPPEWAVVGQWRSDFDGEIVEWQDNEDYRPSPAAMGWPEPADEVDAAIQLATTGYGPAEDVTAALARAEVAVLVTADGEPVRASAPDGTPVVPVYTSPQYLHLAGRLGFEQVKPREFLDRIPEGYSLCLNSSAPVSMMLHTDGLAEAMDRAESAAGPEAGSEPRVPSVDAWPPTTSTEDIGSAAVAPEPADEEEGTAEATGTVEAAEDAEKSVPGPEGTP
ncbi:type VII secretion system-associated protein [Streptomyces sp. NPDC057245]|uniref:type VII secretion system-associated protein n=1 Tax=Streptomyces sp. NPDC057245 TaxID=3346065 RepID=UPI003637472B